MIETFSATDKLRARQQCIGARRSGKIVRSPCENCGAEKTEAHHDDYSKPLDVRWLCKPCHGAFHRGPQSSGPARQKSHCARGHELTGHNLLFARRGPGEPKKRKCRKCHNASARRRQKLKSGSRI